MNTTRRGFLKSSLQSSGLVMSFAVGAKALMLTPAQAFARQLPLNKLDAAQAATLETLAEALVPGAKTAGISHYLDSQLSAESADCLLMIRYLGVPAPYDGFYSACLESTEQQSQVRYQKSLAQLDSQQINDLVGAIAQGKVDDWQGPPAAFFYFVLRADAADVVYGTEAGFERLNIPYMPHIAPPQPW